MGAVCLLITIATQLYFQQSAASFKMYKKPQIQMNKKKK